MVAVAALAASAGAVPPADDHGGLTRTRSAAISGSSVELVVGPTVFDRDVLDPRYSPPLSGHGETPHTSQAPSAADVRLRNPITGIAGCCPAPRAATPPPRRREVR